MIGLYRVRFMLFLLIMLSCALAVPALAQDIPLDHWGAADMLELDARGIIDGSNINPERYVTRAEFTKMIITSLGLKLEALQLQGSASPFVDVAGNHPLKGYIMAAKERGLVGGYSADIFKPEEELRRDQMVVLLLRVMGIDEIAAGGSNLKFKDLKYIPDYALPSIAEGVRLGLVVGDDDNTFRPADKVTIAEAAAFINRWLALKGDRYDYLGTVNAVDFQQDLLEINVHENTIPIPFSADVQVLSQGRPVSLAELQANDPVSVKLNVMGQAVLVTKGRVDLGDVKINLDVRKLPRLNTAAERDELTDSAGVDDPSPAAAGAQPPAANKLTEANLFNPRLPMDADNIGKSLAVTKSEINLPSLMSAAGTDGTGKVVAVIDTGVDPSHPDLAETTSGSPKIIDWVDFTLEGLINTSPAPGGEDPAKVSWQEREYTLGDIPSQSRLFKMGTVNLNDISPLELVDYTREPPRVALVITDSVEKGVYDTVYIDTNDDGSFVDEKALKIYRESHDYALLEYQGRELALVVVDIGTDGDYVQLAGDISGHGTHVAGIIAANGRLTGVAPGAQLMVLKAVDRDGYANPKNIIEAIRYAALHGADIINISLGQYQDIEPGQSNLAKIVNEVVNKYGVVVVTAAGNTGPGINTVAAPADADSAISVGAFVSPRMWQTDFGYEVNQDSLYYFSSVGPRRDGAWYPSIIAPGSAVSTVPRWMDDLYMLTEGTSMAAPHVTGVVAHLLEGADKLGIAAGPLFIKRALEEGARNLDSFEAIEDGHGVLDAYEAWLKLKELKQERKLQGTLYSPEYGSGPGVYAREYLPQRLMFALTNNDTRDYLLEWTSDEAWLKSEMQTTHILRGSTREIPLLFDLPEEAGLYSGVITGDDPEVPGIEVEIPINIVIGEQIHKQRPYVYTTLGSLKPAQLARYFINVPEGANYIKADLEIFPNTSGNYEGRGRLHLINPFGFEEEMSDYAGLAPYTLSRKSKTEAAVYIPEPGTWEVIVYSSAALSSYNTDVTKYQLTVSLGDVISIDSVIKPDLDLVVSPIPETVLKKTRGTVILHIWDKEKGEPYNGSLEINGKFYEIQNGRVEYDINRIKENMRLRFTILR
ncbi:MAG: S8 family serine peptidase [Peptococcaceae bacterium]